MGFCGPILRAAEPSGGGKGEAGSPGAEGAAARGLRGSGGGVRKGEDQRVGGVKTEPPAALPPPPPFSFLVWFQLRYGF